MMKRKLMAAALAGCMIMTSGTSVMAATVANTQSSEAIIEFKSDPTLGSAEPVDPEKPADVIVPETASEKKGGSGNLTIDYISNFNFENGVITGTDQTYYAKVKNVTYTDPDDASNTETRQIPNSVQVTDNRGNGDGWKLKVKQSAFTTSDSDVLVGAELTMANATVNSIVDPTLTPWPTLSSSSYTLKGDNSDVVVMTADVNEGLGTYVAHFGGTRTNPADGDKSVSLFVPGASTKLAKSYTSSLTWTLEDAPN